MKLKANAGKKQSLQPKHNVVGPEKRQRDLPLAMRSRLVPMPSNFLTKSSTFCKTTPPNHQKFCRKPKTNTPSPYPHDPGPPFPTPNLSTAKRSAPTIQIAKGADPMAQIQIQSHPPDSHHKAVPWVMPHTNGLLPDPEIFSGWTSLAVVRFIFYFQHLKCVYPPPGIEFSGSCHQGDSVSVSDISSFIGLFWFCKWPCSELIVRFFELLNLMSSGYREKVWLGQCSFLLWFWMIE